MSGLASLTEYVFGMGAQELEASSTVALSRAHCIAVRIATQMGIRTHSRDTLEILSDIERYIECSTYKKFRNTVGVLSPWP